MQQLACNNTTKCHIQSADQRLKPELDKKLRNNQAGFRSNNCTIDHICTLRIILEQTNEWNKDIDVSFIDFEKAFDRVNRVQMWKILRLYGIRLKIINFIKLFYEDYKANLEHSGEVTEEISIESEVKQGCVLSPTLFLIMIRLGNEKSNRRSNRHQVEPFQKVRRSRICR